MHIYNPRLFLNTAHVAGVLIDRDDGGTLILKSGVTVFLKTTDAESIIKQLSQTPTESAQHTTYRKEPTFNSWWSQRVRGPASYNTEAICYEAWCAAKQDMNNG